MKRLIQQGSAAGMRPLNLDEISIRTPLRTAALSPLLPACVTRPHDGDVATHTNDGRLQVRALCVTGRRLLLRRKDSREQPGSARMRTISLCGVVAAEGKRFQCSEWPPARSAGAALPGVRCMSGLDGGFGQTTGVGRVGWVGHARYALSHQ